MKSVILTKVNRVSPRNFGQEIEWRQGKGDIDFLVQFCEFMNKGSKNTIVDDNTVYSVTKRGIMHHFYIYHSHILRVTFDGTEQRQLKTFYKIS